MIHRIPEYQGEEYAQPLKLSSSDSKYHIACLADNASSPTTYYNLTYDGKTLRKVFYANNGTISSAEPTETSSYAWVAANVDTVMRSFTFINPPVSAGSFNGGLSNYTYYSAVRGDGSSTSARKNYARPTAFLNKGTQTWYVVATIILQRTDTNVAASLYYNIDRTQIDMFKPDRTGTYAYSWDNKLFTKPRTESSVNVTTATFTFTCAQNKGFYLPCLHARTTTGNLWPVNNDYIAESYIGISTES